MPTGTIQFVSSTTENLYITSYPQVSFFKTIYKRHTDYVRNATQEFFDSKLGFGQQIRCRLSKNGDLLNKMSILYKLSNFQSTTPPHSKKIIYGWANAIGHVLTEWIELWIGGKFIDRRYGEWLDIWSSLTITSEKKDGYYEMIGKKDILSFRYDSFARSLELQIPLDFWFCKDLGIALPLFIMREQEVEFVLKVRSFEQCWVSNLPSLSQPNARIDGSILVDYIYLSLEERLHFASTRTHVYLIEQTQLIEGYHLDKDVGNLNIDIDFNHLVKEIIWVIQRQDVIGPPDGTWPEDSTYPKGNDHFNYTTAQVPRKGPLFDTFSQAKIQFYGVDRTYLLPASYYRLWQPYYHHTRVPYVNFIYMFSFAEKPEDLQPTGECNMSGISDAKLLLQLRNKFKKLCTPVNARVYAHNYNLFTISCGLGGVIFAN